MMRYYLYIAIVVATLFIGCSRDRDYPMPKVRAGLSYALSSDTIQFDTLPSGVLSSTINLRLFNPSRKSLVFSRIYLKSGGNRGFQLNINGRASISERDVYLEGLDSLFIFARAFLAEGEGDAPMLVQDSLILVEASGNTNIVPIMAVRQNVRHIEGLIINEDTEIAGGRPLLIKDSLYVPLGVRLTLGGNARFLLGADAHIRIDGTLLVHGTPENKVTMTSIRKDRFLPRVSYSRVPGQWGGVVVGKQGRIIADWLELSNSKWGIYYEDDDSWSNSSEERSILRHCRIHNISGIGLWASRGDYIVEDSEISNTLGTSISLRGGSYKIIRSSVINHYPWPGVRSSYTLSYSNSSKGIVEPESTLSLLHSVVDGSRGLSSSEIELSLLPGSRRFPIVLLAESYLRAKEYNQRELIQQEQIIYPDAKNITPLYRRLGIDRLNRKDYLFDFRPTDQAPFVHKIHQVQTLLPVDLSGRQRSLPASYGAYEP